MSSDENQNPSNRPEPVAPSGKSLPSSAEATRPRVDPLQARIVREFKHGKAIGCCKFDPTGRFLFAGSEDNGILRWDLETGAETTLVGHESWVRGLAFQPSANSLISSGYDGSLIWWTIDAPQPEPLGRLKAHKGWVRSIAVSSDGRFVASCGNDRLVKVWSADDRKLVSEMAGHTQQVFSVAFHPDGKHLVSSDLLGIVKQWATTDWKQVRELDASSMYAANNSNRGSAGGLRSMAFTSQGEHLLGSGVAGGGDPLGQAVQPGVIVFEWQSGKRTSILRPRGNEQGVAWGLTCHPTEKFVIAASGGMSAKHLYFWKLDQEQPLHVVELPSAGRDTSLHPDGVRLAVAQFDGAVRILTLG